MERPLAGIRVMVTRPALASDELAALLRAEGAIVDCAPLVEIGPPPDERALQAAVDDADDADWIVFTSINGVDAFASRRRAPLAAAIRIAAVGAATARAVNASLDREPDVVPARFEAQALADAIAARASKGALVAVFAAQNARPALRRRLLDAGARVQVTEAYSTREAPPADIVRRVSDADIIVLTSGSGARSLVAGLAGKAGRALSATALVCIGPVTAREARRLGLDVAAIAHDATAQGLAAAVARAAHARRR
ncbi:MAG TPA: uroporphyrinogen-III synthase [Candidatus Eremiobacteraceae bacterium]|nr:uroporphyrinogen-III synthase [Candidatus Eremiobacteraceae bacterium]